MYDRDDSAPSLLSFLIGGVVGASLACLLAPQTGTALRRRIRAGVGGGARHGRAAAPPLTSAGQALTGEASEVLLDHAGSARAVPEPALPPELGRRSRG